MRKEVQENSLVIAISRMINLFFSKNTLKFMTKKAAKPTEIRLTDKIKCAST